MASQIPNRIHEQRVAREAEELDAAQIRNEQIRLTAWPMLLRRGLLQREERPRERTRDQRKQRRERDWYQVA